MKAVGDAPIAHFSQAFRVVIEGDAAVREDGERHHRLCVRVGAEDALPDALALVVAALVREGLIGELLRVFSVRASDDAADESGVDLRKVDCEGAGIECVEEELLMEDKDRELPEAARREILEAGLYLTLPVQDAHVELRVAAVVEDAAEELVALREDGPGGVGALHTEPHAQVAHR